MLITRLAFNSTVFIELWISSGSRPCAWKNDLKSYAEEQYSVFQDRENVILLNKKIGMSRLHNVLFYEIKEI